MVCIILSQVISITEGRLQFGAVKPVTNMTWMSRGTPNCCLQFNGEHVTSSGDNRKEPEMEVIYKGCCALDVHEEIVVACLLSLLLRVS